MPSSHPGRSIARRCVLAALLMIAVAVPAHAQGTAAGPPIQLTLAPEHEVWREPIAAAADVAAAVAEQWLGPHPAGSIELADATMQLPLWQGPQAMAMEQQAAFTVVRSWWPAQLANDVEQIVEGLALYLRARAIELLFDRSYLSPGYRAESISYFGGSIAWSFPVVRLTRENVRRESPYAAAFASLERWMGEPALQGAVSAAMRDAGPHASAQRWIESFNRAAGQDLGWVFRLAQQSGTNYSVTALRSDPGACATSCFDTAVIVSRAGSGVFSGRSGERIGGFDAGDALALRVTFASGDASWSRWDGRDDRRTFRFHGPSPAIAAHLDPERVNLLDANLLDNAILTAAPTNVPVRKWMARWMVWVQNTVLSYGFIS